MLWILAKMDDAWESYTAERTLGLAGEKGSYIEFCMPLYPTEQEARLLPFCTKQLDSPQNSGLNNAQSMTMVVTLIQYTVLWENPCFYGHLDQFLLTMNEFGRQ